MPGAWASNIARMVSLTMTLGTGWRGGTCPRMYLRGDARGLAFGLTSSLRATLCPTESNCSSTWGSVGTRFNRLRARLITLHNTKKIVYLLFHISSCYGQFWSVRESKKAKSDGQKSYRTSSSSVSWYSISKTLPPEDINTPGNTFSCSHSNAVTHPQH